MSRSLWYLKCFGLFVVRALSVIIFPVAVFVSTQATTELTRNLLTRFGGQPSYMGKLTPLLIALNGGKAWLLALEIAGPLLLALLLFAMSGWLEAGRDLVGIIAFVTVPVLIYAQVDTYFSGLRYCAIKEGVPVYGSFLEPPVNVPGSVYFALLVLTVVMLILFGQMNNRLVAFVGILGGLYLIGGMCLVSFWDGAFERDRGWHPGFWTVAVYGVMAIVAGGFSIRGRHAFRWGDQ